MRPKWMNRATLGSLLLLVLGATSACTVDRASNTVEGTKTAAGWAGDVLGTRHLDGQPDDPRVHPVRVTATFQAKPGTRTGNLVLVAHTDRQSSGTHNPILTIPLGWVIDVTLLTQSTDLHSINLVPYDANRPSRGISSAYIGTGSVGQSQSFRFKARTPGDYAVVCTKQNHHDGVLAVLRVSADASQPSL